MDLKNINEYATKDLYEAAYIYSLEIPLVRLQKSDKEYYFIFSNKDQCEKLRDLFWGKQTSIDARTYCDAIRSLKDRLFSSPKEDF